ncbi:hypothetical protein [Streptomyces ossamyceticus]|uniref:hypothetical protein n=1 Tax=Streptomyces ossamyceticus TaxID=249581 RepID=UPI0012FF1575|nr:hypothetical protein [Streptomyces ossamyceticus]
MVISASPAAAGPGLPPPVEPGFAEPGFADPDFSGRVTLSGMVSSASLSGAPAPPEVRAAAPPAAVPALGESDLPPPDVPLRCPAP